VEHGDLADAGGPDVVVALDDRAQVQRAERAAGIAAELQVDERLRIGTGTGSPEMSTSSCAVIIWLPDQSVT
jgi:hypothetical protein